VTNEELALKHIQAHHLDPHGQYHPLLGWSTPVEEVAHMRAHDLCTHPLDEIYDE
jgi:hypothetical protein